MTKSKKKLATLVLDPKRWLRGKLAWINGEKDSYLLRVSDRRMCCLGFECRRRGLAANKLAGIGLPSEVVPAGQREIFLSPEPYYFDLESAIADLNDDDEIPLTRKGDLDRVRQLRPFFEKLGVRLVLGRAK